MKRKKINKKKENNIPTNPPGTICQILYRDVSPPVPSLPYSLKLTELRFGFKEVGFEGFYRIRFSLSPWHETEEGKACQVSVLSSFPRLGFVSLCEILILGILFGALCFLLVAEAKFLLNYSCNAL